MYSAIHIGKHLVKEANAINIKDMSQLKLMKIVYIAHGWHLALLDSPMIAEDVEAWKYGPVIPELYRETTQYGNNHIDDMQQIEAVEIDNGKTKAVLTKTLSIYRDHTASALVSITHKIGTPWDQVTDRGRAYGRGIVIPNELIKRYYKGLLD